MPRRDPSLKPTRPRGPARFKERELARALRAARRAYGEAVDRVEIDPASGKIVVILAKQVAPGGDTPENIIDRL